MIKKLFLISIVVIIPLFLISASGGKNVQEYLNDFEEILPDGMGGLTGNGIIAEKFDIEGVLHEILSSFYNERGECLKFLLLLIGGVAIFAIASGCSENFVKHTEAGVGLIVSLSVF